jgi:hypothetical protein
MKVIYLKPSQITYTKTDYSNDLMESVSRAKIQFAIKVKVDGDKYICLDGNKRLSIVNDLNLDISIPVVLTNDFSKQGSTFWGAMNHH